NSVCGCAAGIARPAAVTVALQNDKKPSRTATVFAGQDKEATGTMREYIAQVPSSPSMALFKGNELKYFMPREHIEGRDIQEICMDIKDAFDEYCDQFTHNNFSKNKCISLQTGRRCISFAE